MNWNDICWAWVSYQKTYRGNAKREAVMVRDFVGTVLAELDDHPETLSPEGYARFFDSMDVAIPWPHLDNETQDVRRDIMVLMGLVAQRSGKERPTTGGSIEAHWARQMRKTLDTLGRLWPASLTGDMSFVLDSALSNHFKLRACQNLHSPSAWLEPLLVPRIKSLLPAREQDAFKYFAWDHEKPALNKHVVSTYLPAAHSLLDLGLPDNAWSNQETVANALAAMDPESPGNRVPDTNALPMDFSGPA